MKISELEVYKGGGGGGFLFKVTKATAEAVPPLSQGLQENGRNNPSC